MAQRLSFSWKGFFTFENFMNGIHCPVLCPLDPGGASGGLSASGLDGPFLNRSPGMVFVRFLQRYDMVNVNRVPPNIVYQKKQVPSNMFFLGEKLYKAPLFQLSWCRTPYIDIIWYVYTSQWGIINIYKPIYNWGTPFCMVVDYTSGSSRRNWGSQGAIQTMGEGMVLLDNFGENPWKTMVFHWLSR